MTNIISVIITEKHSRCVIAEKDVAHKISALNVDIGTAVDQGTAVAEFECKYGVSLDSVIDFAITKEITQTHSSGKSAVGYIGMMRAEVDTETAEKLISSNKLVVRVNREVFQGSPRGFTKTLKTFCNEWFGQPSETGQTCVNTQRASRMKLE